MPGRAKLCPCCADLSNRVPQLDHDIKNETLELCGVCGRRHFELTIDKAVFFSRGTSAQG